MRAQLLKHAREGKATHVSLLLRAVSNMVSKRDRQNDRAQLPADLIAFISEVLEVSACAAQADAPQSLAHAYVMLAYNLLVWYGRLNVAESDFYLVLVSALLQILQRATSLKDKTVFYALITLGGIGFVSDESKSVVRDGFAEQLIAVCRTAKLSTASAVREVAEDCVRVFTLNMS